MFRYRFDVKPSKKKNDGIDRFFRNSEPTLKHSHEFVQYACPGNKLVFGKNRAKNIRTQSACCICAYQYIRIEKDSHDTSWNTSSSVRYPRASAKGSTSFLS